MRPSSWRFLTPFLALAASAVTFLRVAQSNRKYATSAGARRLVLRHSPLCGWIAFPAACRPVSAMTLTGRVPATSGAQCTQSLPAAASNGCCGCGVIRNPYAGEPLRVRTGALAKRVACWESTGQTNWTFTAVAGLGLRRTRTARAVDSLAQVPWLETAGSGAAAIASALSTRQRSGHPAICCGGGWEGRQGVCTRTGSLRS